MKNLQKKLFPVYWMCLFYLANMVEGLTKTILELQDIQVLTPDLTQLKIIPRQTCEQIQVLIFGKEKNTIKLLTTNNFPEQLQKLLTKLQDKGFKEELYYTSVEGFQFGMTWYDQLEHQEADQREQQQEQQKAEGTSALAMIKMVFDRKETMEPGEFVMELVRLSFQTGASDLHFQPEAKGVLMKVRRDGVLQDILDFSHQDFWQYIQKLKFIAGVKMNVDYIPQDGRFSFQASDPQGNQRTVDARVSFMPGIGSESVVMRFLDPTKGISTFEKIGFSSRTYDVLKRNLEKTTGITIMTGPTGSGKTTTLYTILNSLNTGDKKIITLEDPVEYQLSGIQQSQINPSKGYTYEEGLKAILRHDPDVILVGETRSGETAETSINAALTGHMVFTTLHTNSAVEALTRLLNMGVKPYMLAPSLNLVLAQRLVRKLCPHCATKRDAVYGEEAEIKESITKISDVLPSLSLSFDGKIPQAVGCAICNATGYIGRIAILEAFEVTDEIRTMIVEGRYTLDIYGKLRENGYLTMREDGLLKMLDGLTTLDELRRVI